MRSSVPPRTGPDRIGSSRPITMASSLPKVVDGRRDLTLSAPATHRLERDQAPSVRLEQVGADRLVLVPFQHLVLGYEPQELLRLELAYVSREILVGDGSPARVGSGANERLRPRL